MQKLSINELDKIPSIELTLDLARRGRDIPDDHAQALLGTALHEAAHVVGALACKGGCVLAVLICQSARPRRRAAGEVNSGGNSDRDDAFMTLTGYAWEELRGDIRRASDDLQGGKQIDRANWEENLQNARRFVVEQEQVIRYATVGILLLMTTTGRLDGKRMQKLVRWLRPQVPQYRF